MYLVKRFSCDLQLFCKEVLVAKHVENENVLAIVGVQMTDDLKLCIVSEWMEHGNMLTYLRSNKVADRMELVSLRPIHYTPLLTRSRAVAWCGERSRILTLDRSSSRGPEKCKLSIFTSTFRVAESE